MVAREIRNIPAEQTVQVTPRGALELLTHREVEALQHTHQGRLRALFRKCALAVLNAGSEIDDTQEILRLHQKFSVELVSQTRGVALQLQHTPETAFVDGEMIAGINEHLFSVLRDIVFMATELDRFASEDPAQITELVFHFMRNAGCLEVAHQDPGVVVCWGGHAIDRQEYDYTKRVGYQLGLRGLNVCTGCGPGAMKGPMKGAAVGHAKQRISGGRFLGITEPGIIAAESPNAMVNELVIMPDIEKRLEAFVRTGHAIIVFPGGVGTAEEILYLLGVLLHPDNEGHRFPLIFTGPEQSAPYFEGIDRLLRTCLGEEACALYEIVMGEPETVARHIAQGVREVTHQREQLGDARSFNWSLHIPPEFQQPFVVSHDSMAQLDLRADQPRWQLAAALRRAFSGIVAGNVKQEGIALIEQDGPFSLRGEPEIMQILDETLQAFVDQRRMKIAAQDYTPCYELVLD